MSKHVTDSQLINVLGDLQDKADERFAKRDIVALVETSTAKREHDEGSYLTYNGKIYICTDDIAIGDELDEETNIEEATLPEGTVIFSDGDGEVEPDLPDGKTVTPINDVATWLACGGITYKSYSTISQVLADSTTIGALVGSENAVDYMARSTDFASSICDDEYAMTLIGLNNYCADELLDDADWCEAICNSTHFEKVLNVKVPVMTSNTAPYGEVSVSSTYGEPAFSGYKAFDSTSLDGSTGWLPSSLPGWLSYKFTNPVSIKKIKINTVGTETYTYNGKIQVSNDNSTWTDIANISSVYNNTPTFIDCENDDYYLYARFYYSSNSMNKPSAGSGIKLQFYGREDV